MKKTNAEAVKAYKARQKAKGIVQWTVRAHQDDSEKIKAYIRKLNKARGI